MSAADIILKQMDLDKLDLADPRQRELFEHFHARYRFAALACAGKRVLDVACDLGFGAAILAETGGALAVEAADSDATVVAAAARRHAGSGVAFRRMDLERLEGGPYGVVVSYDTLDHIPRPEPFLEQVRRVLSPDGVFFVSAYVTPTRDVNPYHHHNFSLRSLQRLVRRHGFETVSVLRQIQRYRPAEAARLMRTKRGEDAPLEPPRSIVVHYLRHPLLAMERIGGILRHGFTIQHVVLRTRPLT